MSYRQITTHYEGCESTHHDCALARLEEARNELTAERARREKAEAELAAVKEDAERYQHLMLQHIAGRPTSMWIAGVPGHDEIGHFPSASEVTEAIDADRKP